MVSVLSSYYEKFLATGEVKCIDEEIPFEIPQGWEWCRIRDISNSYIGLTYRPTDISQTGTVVLRSSNIQEGKLCLRDIVRVNTNIPEKLWVQNNDILICARNGSKKLVGKSAIIAGINEPMTFGAFMAICKTPFYKYVYLFLQSDCFFSQLREVSGTTTINQLTQNNFNAFLIPLPSVLEQQRIVAKVEELMPILEKYNKSQTNLNKLNNEIGLSLKKSILQEAIQGKLVSQIAEEGTAQELLEQIKQEKQKLVKEGKLKKSALTDSVIFKGDDNKYYEQIGTEVIDITDEIPFEIPKNWIWTRLKNFCSVCTGATFKKEEMESEHCGIRVLRGGNIKPFQLCAKPDDIFIPQSKVKEDILLKHNDIVTPAVTSLENIGKMARVELDMPHTTVGGFVFIIRPLDGGELLSKYLLAFMSSPSAIDFMKSITNKSGQAFYNIGKERLVTALVPIPPLAEQERIVSKIEKLFEQLR